MFGLSEKIRWILLFLGLVFVILGILDQKNVLAVYPFIEFIVFPYIWVVGCALIFVAYGFTDDSQKYSGSGGIGGTPGVGEKKRGPFGDDSFWGGGDGTSGGGND